MTTVKVVQGSARLGLLDRRLPCQLEATSDKAKFGVRIGKKKRSRSFRR